MQFLNLDGSTTGKDEQVITNALHRVVTTAKEKGQRWEKRDSTGKCQLEDVYKKNPRRQPWLCQ